jgi:hypothetical protein
MLDDLVATCRVLYRRAKKAFVQWIQYCPVPSTVAYSFKLDPIIMTVRRARTDIQHAWVRKKKLNRDGSFTASCTCAIIFLSTGRTYDNEDHKTLRPLEEDRK